MAWLTGWTYRRKHDILGAVGAGIGYTVCVKVYAGSGVCGTELIRKTTAGKMFCNNHAKADFGDLRFTSSDGSTLLGYWTEKKVDGDYAVFWVKLTEDLTANCSIYVYYGKVDAVYDGDGNNAFMFFDDFSAGLDWVNKWQSTDQSFYSVENGALKMLYPAATSKLIQTKTKFNAPYSVECLIRQSVASKQSYFTLDPNAAAWVGKEMAVLEWNVNSMAVFIAGSVTRISYTQDLASFFKAEYFCTAGGIATLSFYKGDVLKVSRTATPTNRNVYVGFFTWMVSAIGYVDEVFVRRWVSPEPQHDYWGNETNESGSVALVEAEPYGILEDAGKEGELIEINAKEGTLEEVPL